MSTTFSELGIHAALQKSLAKLEISIPTDVQEKTIPLILHKKEDVVVLAKTGTGKTAAFGLPILQLVDSESKDIQALILAPTRELGHQIYDNLISFCCRRSKSNNCLYMRRYPYKTSNRTFKRNDSYRCCNTRTFG